MKVDLTLRSEASDSYRVSALEGMFDLNHQNEWTHHIEADLPIEDLDWQLGLIVGASGAGKSSVAKHLWPDNYFQSFTWSKNCMLDDFPDKMRPQDIGRLLNSVGLSSVPCWMRPYAALSTGQKFRADLARSLAESDFVVFDEFTSTVDRTVAKAACVGLNKAMKRMDNKRFIGISCHSDIISWLQPDWVYNLDSSTFIRSECLQPRPKISVTVRIGDKSAWPIFSQHHYMSAELSNRAQIFLVWATLDDEERLIGFVSVIPSMGHKGCYSEHRTVVLPDFQGLGIGGKMVELVAEYLWKRDRKYFTSTTSSPVVKAYRMHRSDIWKPTRPVGLVSGGSKTSMMKSKARSTNRFTSGWKYCPEGLRSKS